MSKTIDLSQRDFTRSRSASYQYVICETQFFEGSEEYLLTDEALLTDEEREQLSLIEDEIRARRLLLVSVYCTPKQAHVFFLCASGLYQEEVAKLLNCNQSSVVKTLTGSASYSEKDCGKKYGGVQKKMRAVAAKDLYLQYLYQQMENIKNGKQT